MTEANQDIAVAAALGGPLELVDCVIVGAGVVGLAIARELSSSGRDVIILETESLFGSVTSARNSEVIHAGIYYPANSLKAELCVRGRQLLYQYCENHYVQYRRCGKLIVATDSAQRETLGDIKQRAEGNGVLDLKWVDKTELQCKEPNISGVAALESPSTGIVDSHGLMLSLLGESEAHGAVIAYGAPVCKLEPKGSQIQVLVHGDDPMRLQANTVINCAGLGAVALANQCDGLAKKCVPTQVLAKGNYFALAGKAPVRRLIYPVPEPGGLGVHITLDLAGRARFGPDVEWVDEIHYDVDVTRAEKFYAAIRRYWPDLPDSALQPEYSGMRPKIRYGDEIEADFVISGPAEHGVNGLVNLFGIESPGLTSCLAIAERVAQKL